MKKLISLCCLLAVMFGYSQVGIGTTDPQANLDIIANNSATPANTDGLLIPRINAFPLIDPTIAQNGMLVFLSTATDPASPFGANPVGVYYWSSALSKWIGVTASSWLVTGNSGTVDGTNFIGTTDNIPLNFKINNQKAGTLSTDHTFFGHLAGNSNTVSGINNLGMGQSSLTANTVGSSNTATGSGTLTKNISGSDNTASGYRALHENLGNANSAYGKDALYTNTSGSENTAMGFQALFHNSTSGQNVAIGYEALYNTAMDSNTAVGFRTLYANVTGDSNTAIGKEALRNNTANSNTAIGRDALYSNTSGENNTASGRNSLRSNTTGNDNTATGHYSLISNITGSSNTATGINSMNKNTLGSNNTAIGEESLFNNIGGNDNTALGFAALYANTAGSENTAIGHESSRNTTGNFNTSIGTDALHGNNTGNNNTAIGHGALQENSTGSNNTAIGQGAGLPFGSGDLINTTALGSGAIVTASNKVRIGNTDVTVIEGQVAMSVTSDQRSKNNIHTIPLGLEFINLLRPVEYIKKNNSEQTKEWGLIAQELQQALLKLNYKDAGLVTDDHSKDHFLSVRYTDLIAPMIKSIQQLYASQKEIETLKQKISDQDTKLEQLMKRLEKLEQSK